jgi:hypothetical protein
MESYDPILPWVHRVQKDGSIAGGTPGYVDDLHTVGHSKGYCRALSHQTASRLGYLGIQNASGKTRPPSQEPGAWTGIIAFTGQHQ